MTDLKKKISVGIVGCGKIFHAHLHAIEVNSNEFELKSVCDIDHKVVNNLDLPTNIVRFSDYEKMLFSMRNMVDMIVVATPNSLHKSQAIRALRCGYDVLIEKPVSFTAKGVEEIEMVAQENEQKAFGVFQVRYNSSVVLLKKIIGLGLLGDIRSVSLVQRWQRPFEYFNDWRGDIKIGGRTLYEVGIHYLDIVRWIFNNPRVLYTKTFQLKHKSISFEDSIYSIVEFPGGVAGTIEVTIAAEPHNLECSLTLIGEKGVVKVGGKALNSIELIEFVNDSPQIEEYKKAASMINECIVNDYGKYQGSSPNHPRLYKSLADGDGIRLLDIAKTILFIEDIYNGEKK